MHRYPGLEATDLYRVICRKSVPMPTIADAQRVRNRRWYAIPENRDKARRKCIERHARLKDDPEYREQRLSYRRKWRAANPEKVRDAAARQRAKHGDKMNERTRKWRQANPGVCTAQTRKYRKLPAPTRPMPETCDCCGGPPNGRGSLHLDHCHETGKFRGWLCHKCNAGLGLLGDNNFGLQRMSMYLARAGDASI